MTEALRTANDPNSIEYVETLRIDTITKNEERLDMIDLNGDLELSAFKQYLNARSAIFMDSLDGDAIDPKDIEERTKYYAKTESIKAKRDSLIKTMDEPDSNAMVGVYHYCTIRGKNAMGALVLNTYKATFINGKLERLIQVDD